MGENVSLFVAYSATSIVKTFRKNKWLIFFFSKSLQYVSVILKKRYVLQNGLFNCYTIKCVFTTSTCTTKVYW